MLISALRTMNEKLLNLIKNIITNDDDALIVINGDHGICVGDTSWSQEKSDLFWNKWGQNISNTQAERRFKNLVAIRLPEDKTKSQSTKESISEKISNVNIFRSVFRYLGIENLKNLEDKAVLFDYDENHQNFYFKKDVTNIIKNSFS